MLTKEQNKQLLEAVELINKADALMQAALGADDEVYYIHTQLENAADDILEFVQERNDTEAA